jgi:hypothetical protein
VNGEEIPVAENIIEVVALFVLKDEASADDESFELSGCEHATRSGGATNATRDVREDFDRVLIERVHLASVQSSSELETDIA